MIHATADVDPRASVHPSADIWHLAQVREFATIGAQSSVGRGAYVGSGVHIGAACKIQNGAMLYEPAHIEDGVFVGPGAILTNDRHPRAVMADGTRKTGSDWEPVGVRVLRGASLGAGSICVAPVSIGQWALVGAGAVVTSNIPAFALVAGAPARRVGWVGRAGARLTPSSEETGVFLCPITGMAHVVIADDVLEEMR